MAALYPNHVWTYDFMEDRTANGRKIRILNVVDEFTRVCLACEVARRFDARAVIAVLEKLFARNGMPEYLRSDNGSEFMNTLNEYLYWYNGKRIKISLGAKSPLEYRRMDPAAQQSK